MTSRTSSKTQEYPEGASKNDKKTLRRLAGSFYLNQDDVLYTAGGKGSEWIIH